MKRLVHGPTDRAWVFEIINRCSHCEVRYQLEPGDWFVVSVDGAGNDYVQSYCPVCHAYVLGSRQIMDHYDLRDDVQETAVHRAPRASRVGG